MEDIEDLLIGNGSGSPPGFRLPLNAVGVNLKKNKNKPKLHAKQLSETPISSKIPGTQTIYIKTFGCSHNQASLMLFFRIL
ncbi:hypothetical protein NC651_030558 [Populus alba x Populus x berolinensis]|nr:hypothetical protein NC651_030558 [Populus alba x Populus x berolinensis]